MGRLYQYHYFTFHSQFFNSSFIAAFYLTLSCWTGRQQDKAKHISHWKYSHHPSSECVLFLLQLCTAPPHTALVILKAWGKQATRAKQAKKTGAEISSFIAFLLKLNCILQEWMLKVSKVMSDAIPCVTYSIWSYHAEINRHQFTVCIAINK